jgi:hypothetical protein
MMNAGLYPNALAIAPPLNELTPNAIAYETVAKPIARPVRLGSTISVTKASTVGQKNAQAAPSSIRRIIT